MREKNINTLGDLNEKLIKKEPREYTIFRCCYNCTRCKMISNIRNDFLNVNIIPKYWPKTSYCDKARIYLSI